MFWLPLIISIIYFLLSYIMCRSSFQSMYNEDLSEIWLVKSKLLKKYFLNPKDGLTKHLVFSHFLGLFLLIFNIVLYALYLLNGCTGYILNSETYLITLGAVILGVNLIVYSIDALIYIKVFNKDKW